VSWDLTEPRQSSIERQIDDLEQRIQILADQESDLQASIDAAINAKQKADLHRTTSEAELHQIQAQITEQEALKQTLHQTILELEQQQQQLQAEIPQLHTQIQELEEYRTTLEQTIQSGTQAGSSAGVTALQSTIEQMQSQIGALRSELEDLETQIIDRRNHKQLLDQAVDCSSTASGPTTPVVAPSPTTNAAATQLQLLEIADPTAPSITSTDRPATTPSTRIEATITTEPEVVLAAEAGQKNQKTPSRQSPPYQENGLSAEWIAFKGNLQPYEFQALCAIALEENPTSVLKQLAESNLTMPEMLIDTINEQALESIGDLILEAGHDAASTIIAQEYRDEVATLIATHR
jgi:predicted  nucleic acid-binding Zn-ribbon protein